MLLANFLSDLLEEKQVQSSNLIIVEDNAKIELKQYMLKALKRTESQCRWSGITKSTSDLYLVKPRRESLTKDEMMLDGITNWSSDLCLIKPRRESPTRDDMMEGITKCNSDLCLVMPRRGNSLTRDDMVDDIVKLGREVGITMPLRRESSRSEREDDDVPSAELRLPSTSTRRTGGGFPTTLPKHHHTASVPCTSILGRRKPPQQQEQYGSGTMANAKWDNKDLERISSHRKASKKLSLFGFLQVGPGGTNKNTPTISKATKATTNLTKLGGKNKLLCSIGIKKKSKEWSQ